MLLDLLRARRSLRRFADDRPVEPETIDRLLEAALLSPSSKNLKPWHFVVVRDRETLLALSAAKPQGASFLKHAAAAIVVCGDTTVSDVWVEDCAIAALLVHLEAADLGLASCWVQLRKRQHDEHTSSPDYVAKLLGLPETVQVLAVVGVGHPTETKPPHDPAGLRWGQVREERFGVPWRK